jgi:hypothetical protein
MRKTAEHLAMGSWLLPLLGVLMIAAAFSRGDRVRMAGAVLAVGVGLVGLLMGMMALRQVPHFGKRHIFGHAVAGLALSVLLLSVGTIFLMILLTV